MNSELVKSDIKLTIGMLVSNHVQYIRNCMESIKPLLEAVPSELIVIDTKGEETDGSIAIVKEYTDKIYPFVWCDDFAAARNECIKRAKGEWFLYFDDDEWFDDVQEFIDFFQSGECEKYRSGFYYTRDYRFGGGYSMGIAGRMVRMQKNTHFIGKVHEGFNFATEPVKLFSCFTHHQGYIYTTEEMRKKHQERNLKILRKEEAESGKTPRICAQMVQELMTCDDTRQEGIRYCEESAEELICAGKGQDACTQWLLITKLKYLSTSKTYEESLAYAKMLQENYQLTETARQALSGLMVAAAVKKEKYEDILSYATLYQKMHRWYKENPALVARQLQLDLPDYGTEAYACYSLQAGAVAANKLCRYEDAYEFWCDIAWGQEDIDCSFFKDEVLRTLRGKEDKRELVKFYQHFYREELFLKENRIYLPKECKELL